MHSLQRPAKCDLCGKAFKNSSSVRWHKVNEHGHEAYPNMNKKTTATTNGTDKTLADMVREYMAVDPKQSSAEIVKRLKSDHGVIANLHSVQCVVAKERGALAAKGVQVRKPVLPITKPHVNGNGHASLADHLITLSGIVAALGGKDKTKQVIDLLA